MAVSVKQLKQDFPEFNDIANNIVSSRIAMATRDVNTSIFGSRSNDAIKWLACHYIATSPLGENVKVRDEDGTTTYYVQYKRIRKAVTLGLRYV